MFDEASVKSAITDVFRAKGFSATSLDDLAQATNLTRPSLYGAFGDKEAMFLMALDCFAHRIKDSAGGALQRGDTLQAALAGFYDEILDTYFGDSKVNGLGCLIFATALAEVRGSLEIQARLRAYFDQFSQTLIARVDELLPSTPSAHRAAIATLSISLLHSLAIRARVGEPRRELEKSVEQALEFIA